MEFDWEELLSYLFDLLMSCFAMDPNETAMETCCQRIRGLSRRDLLNGVDEALRTQGFRGFRLRLARFAAARKLQALRKDEALVHDYVQNRGNLRQMSRESAAKLAA